MKAESTASFAFLHGLVLDLPRSCTGVLGYLVLLFSSAVVPAACCKACNRVATGLMLRLSVDLFTLFAVFLWHEQIQNQAKLGVRP